MGDIEKRLNKAAVKLAEDWGTAVDTDAAGMGFLPLNPGAPKAAVQMMEDESYGAFETNLDVGPINPTDFALDFDYRWDGRENLLLAMLMGTAGVPGIWFKVTAANNKLDFGEGGAEITATLTNDVYTPTDLCTEIKTQLDVGGALTYTVTYSATTRKFTIAATGEFELKWNTGTHKATDCSVLLGFSDAADDTGAATYTSDVAGVGGLLSCYHSFSLANSIFGLFGTYATEKYSKIHTVPSFKVMKGMFSLSGGLIKAALNLRGIQVLDDSALPAAFTSTTVPGNTHARAKFSQATFRMNAQDGDALDDDDIVRPKSFTLEIERKMDSEHVAGVQTIVEPRENDKPSVKLTLEFARMDTANAAYFADWIAGTEKKATLEIEGPEIEADFNYYLGFEFPRFIIEDVEYADSKIIPAKIVLRGVTADEAPSGMTAVLPVACQLINTIDGDYLA